MEELKFTAEIKDGKWQVNGRTFKDMTLKEREAVEKFIKSYDIDSSLDIEIIHFENL